MWKFKVDKIAHRYCNTSKKNLIKFSGVAVYNVFIIFLTLKKLKKR